MLHAAVEALASQRLLVGIGAPNLMTELYAGLELVARRETIPFVCVNSTDIENQLSELLEASKPDVVCVMGLPFKISSHLLEQPRFGFFNLHGGALPSYRGPDPVFWQIRSREPNAAVTIHRMTSELDAGGVAHVEPVPIGPHDTYGLYMQRLGRILSRVMIEFVQSLAIHGDGLPLEEQSESQARYWKRPGAEDMTVDWTAPPEAIDALVRACNPRYGGALISIRGVPVRLLQVTDGGSCDSVHQTPGHIFEASPEEGIRVVCGDGRTLFLDILYAEDGFFTGRSLAKLFAVHAGETVYAENLHGATARRTDASAAAN